jgi:hypothetical protein
MLWHGRMRLRPVGIRSVSCDLCPLPPGQRQLATPAGPLARVVSLLFLRRVCGAPTGAVLHWPFWSMRRVHVQTETG